MLKQLEKLAKEICEQSEIESLSQKQNDYLEQIAGNGSGLSNHDNSQELIALSYDAALVLGYSESGAKDVCGDTAREHAAEAKAFLAQFKTKQDLASYMAHEGERADNFCGEDYMQQVFDSRRHGVGSVVSVGTGFMNSDKIYVIDYTGSKVADWAYVYYIYAGPYVDEIAAALRAKVDPVEPQYDYPEGRELDCGCVVYFQNEVMSASLGSSCEGCYDKMSG